MKYFIFIIFLSIPLFSQKTILDKDSNLVDVVYSVDDSLIVENIFNFAGKNNLNTRPIEEVLFLTGEYFIGTPYEAGTIENPDNEKMVIHLTGFDCYTLVETCFSLARCIKSNKMTFTDFEQELIGIRYRNGYMRDYASRLHYFSEWISYNNSTGSLKNITSEISGILYDKKINFMSNHSDSYPALKREKKLIPKISVVEALHSNRTKYYIPKEKINLTENSINSGYIIGITTSIEGLDISHTGIAVKDKDGKVYLLHAPNKGQKVQITKIPLSEYLKKHKTQTGIMVAQPLEP